MELVRIAFATGITKPMEFRVSQLKALNQCIEEHREIWLEVLHKDLNKVSAAIQDNLANGHQ